MGNTPSPDPGGNSGYRQDAWRRRSLAFRLAAGFTVFCLVLVSLELLFGFLRLDRYDDEFTPRSSYPLFVPGEGPLAGSCVTNRHFRRSLNFQKFSRRKGNGVFRVFVLGGSAAYGWPSNDSAAFTGYLRRALDQAAPGRFEIVNAAGISYGSYRMLDLLTDVLRFEPDLVVIYEGNNEYVERNVLPSGERGGGPLYAVRNQMSRTNIYRALRLAIWKMPGMTRILARSRTRSADITDPRANPDATRADIVPTPAIRAEVLGSFRQNVSEMARRLEERSVASVFCSVPVNLEAWPPMGIPLQIVDKNETRRLEATLREGLASMEKDPKRAATLLQEVVQAKPDWAPGAYSLAQALEAEGNYSGALEMFREALNRDARPLRAVDSINTVLRSLAASGRHVSFLDLEAIFREKSPNGITGAMLMRDHCIPRISATS